MLPTTLPNEVFRLARFFCCGDSTRPGLCGSAWQQLAPPRACREKPLRCTTKQTPRKTFALAKQPAPNGAPPAQPRDQQAQAEEGRIGDVRHISCPNARARVRSELSLRVHFGLLVSYRPLAHAHAQKRGAAHSTLVLEFFCFVLISALRH